MVFNMHILHIHCHFHHLSPGVYICRCIWGGISNVFDLMVCCLTQCFYISGGMCHFDSTLSHLTHSFMLSLHWELLFLLSRKCMWLHKMRCSTYQRHPRSGFLHSSMEKIDEGRVKLDRADWAPQEVIYRNDLETWYNFQNKTPCTDSWSHQNH